MLEMFLQIPPSTSSVISLQFNRAFLKWTEHPPDAHHGFYIKWDTKKIIVDREE